LRWDTPGLTWDGNIPEPPTQPKKMPQLRVLLGFTNAPDHSVEETAQAVLDHLYGNPAYPDPPVLQPALQAVLTAFSHAIAAAHQGGPADTADKNNKRDIVIDLLRQLAGYVQSKHGNNLATLLTSGFEAVSTNRSSSPLNAPTIKDILNGNTGQLILRVSPIANASNYEVRFAAIGAGGAPGPWQGGGVFGNSRSMPVNNLTPGTNYIFQVRAIGGSTGYSDWSDAVSHMSM
jgi:hypothetical protein